MEDFINIGCTPTDVDCAQVGREDYPQRSRAECVAFKDQLRRKFPQGDFRIKSFPHDFGTYREVVAYFEDSDSSPAVIATRKAAFDAEADTPPYWDSEARADLINYGFPVGSA